MGIKKSVISLFILFVGLATTSMNCGECVETRFAFDVPVSITPTVDSVRVGDTLLIESTAGFMLMDYNSNKVVSFRNARVGPILNFVDLSIPNKLIPALNDFSVLLFEGSDTPVQDSNKDRSKIILYSTQGETYKLRAAIIPNKKGVYAISVAGGGNISGEGYGNCDQASFGFHYMSTRTLTSFKKLITSDKKFRQENKYQFIPSW